MTIMKKITFNISELHCSSCKTLVESEVGDLPGVKKVIVLFEKGRAGVEYDETKIDLDKIFSKIKELGYTPELLPITEAGRKPFNYNWFWAGAFLLIFVVGLFLIESLGGFQVMSHLNDSSVSFGLIFVIGLLASFHCVGMCGGFIMAYSVSAQKKAGNEPSAGEKRLKNYHLHLQYNAGRLISYTIVGGILGGFGSFFGINPIVSGTLLIVAAAFMVLMGLSLSTEIKLLEKIKLRTPDFIAKFIFKNRRERRPKGPFVIGLMTGFMPCGPLQAMELFALSTGSWESGALSMAVYALGTIPLLFGFGTFVSTLTSGRMKQLLRISGIIVMLLGLFTLSRGLSSFGIFAKPASPAPAAIETPVVNSQTVEMTVSYSGYQPNTIYIKKGVPVHWIIHHPRPTGCTDAIILYNGSQQTYRDLASGDTIIDFTPVSGVNEIRFSCGMKMVWGKFIVQ
jgi:sulfite exporter TauE/SafE/copper chaperone CopZ